MEFLKFRWLCDLGGRTKFQSDLEVGAGDVAGWGKVLEIEGERTGLGFKSDLEGAAGEAVDGFDVKDPDDSGAVFEGPGRRSDALECEIPSLQLTDLFYCCAETGF